MPHKYGSPLPCLGEYNRSGSFCLEGFTVGEAVELRAGMEGIIASAFP